MPIGIPARPGFANLDGLVVGRAAAAGHMQHLAGELAHLVGYALPPITSQTFRLGLGATVAYLGYVRSPGAQTVLVEVEAQHSGGAGDAAVSVTVGSSAGTVSVVETGTTTLVDDKDVSSRSTVKRDTWRGHVDVTGLPVGTFGLLTLTLTNNKAGAAYFYRVGAIEVPLASASPVDDPANEIGIDAAWPQARNEITEGDEGTTYPRGWRRVWAQMAKARKDVKRHLNLSGTWTSGDTVVGSAFPFVVGANPTWRIRPRRLYTTASPNVCTLRAFYAAPAGSFTLRAAVTAVDSGVTTNTDLTLALGTTSASTTLNLPTSGTGQEVDVQFQLWRWSGAGSATVANVSIIESEA
jgi:hypothetical protein